MVSCEHQTKDKVVKMFMAYLSRRSYRGFYFWYRVFKRIINKEFNDYLETQILIRTYGE